MTDDPKPVADDHMRIIHYTSLTANAPATAVASCSCGWEAEPVHDRETAKALHASHVLSVPNP